MGESKTKHPLLTRANLRRKVTLLLLALSLIPLGITGLVAFRWASEGVKDTEKQRFQQAAEFVAESFSERLGQVLSDTRVAAERFKVERLDFQAARAHLEQGHPAPTTLEAWPDVNILTALRSTYLAGFATLDDGRLFHITPYNPLNATADDGSRLSLPPEFKPPLHRARLLVGTLPGYSSEGRPAVLAVAPLRTQSAPKPAGYIGLLVNSTLFDEPLAMAFKLGLQGKAGATARLLYPKEGGPMTVLAELGTLPTGMEERLANHPWERMAGELSVQSGAYLITRAPIAGTGWWVELITKTESAYRSVNRLIWLVAFVIALTLVTVLLLAEQVADVILQPLIELERGAQMLGAGALDYRIDLEAHGDDELGKLAETFNEMGESLLRSRQEVEAYGRHLETANRELDAMVFAISHDLKKKLRAIEAFATFLEEDYADRLDDEGLDLVKSIERNVDRINALADDLIGLVENERTRQLPTRFNLYELLVEVRDRVLGRRSGEVLIEPGMPDVVAVRDQILLAFVNLVDNGLKFNQHRRPVVKIELRDEPFQWAIDITDNGIGIDPRYHGRIFELFTRLNHEDDYPGTGAGLNLAKRVLVEHRGEILVESELGQGSRFTVILPKEPALLTSPGVHL